MLYRADLKEEAAKGILIFFTCGVKVPYGFLLMSETCHKSGVWGVDGFTVSSLTGNTGRTETMARRDIKAHT